MIIFYYLSADSWCPTVLPKPGEWDHIRPDYGPGGDGDRVFLPLLLPPDLLHGDGRGAGAVAGGGRGPGGQLRGHRSSLAQAVCSSKWFTLTLEDFSRYTLLFYSKYSIQIIQ